MVKILMKIFGHRSALDFGVRRCGKRPRRRRRDDARHQLHRPAAIPSHAGLPGEAIVRVFSVPPSALRLPILNFDGPDLGFF